MIEENPQFDEDEAEYERENSEEEDW